MKSIDAVFLSFLAETSTPEVYEEPLPLQSVPDGEASYAHLSMLASLFERVTSSTAIVQNSYDVVVDIQNAAGDAIVSHKYDISNFGIETIADKTHRFWFPKQLEEITPFGISDKNEPLTVEILESSLTDSEVKVNFSIPLEPADRYCYQAQYALKNVLNENFIVIGTRSVTSKLSLTVIAPKGMRFSSKEVIVGDTKGTEEPLISIVMDGDRERLCWQHRKPRAADKYRTYWTLVPTNH